MTEPNAQNNIISELRQLNELVEETSASLKAQKEILQKRGMNLPPLVTTALDAVKRDLAKIEQTIFQEQTELSQLRALADMSANVNTSLDLDRILEDAMDVVITLTGAERGYIILKNPDNGELEYRVTRNNELSAMRGDENGVQISQTILREVLSQGVAMLTDNAYQDERLQGNVSIANFSLRSVLCVPLNHKGETIGVVYVDNRLKTGIFSEREKNLLVAFANTAAVAIANARLYARIQQTLDEITSVKELMDNVFASIGSGIIATDADDKVTIFTPPAEQILQRTADDTIGKSLRSILPKASSDWGEHLSNVREHAQTEIIDAEIEVPDRGRVALSLKMTPLRDSDNLVQGVAVVMDDVTDQRQRDIELDVMKRYLPPQMVDNIHTISTLALGGEKRTMTCMFVDVRPLSTMPQGLRPAEIMNETNIFLAMATECIHRLEGIIDKYMGTEVMALFNTQLNPMDNHAQRAVEVALLMRDEFAQLYQRLGINPNPHFYRIGIHTGLATLGNVGSLNRRDFTAIGDTINLAKRLEENATNGQIIISENTHDHLIAFSTNRLVPLDFVEREPLKVKGREQYTRIFEVFRKT